MFMASTEIRFKSLTPILRMIDEQQTKHFYEQFLGFHIDWEHRFEEGFPLYMQISRGGILLHLSEHYGDCNPGGAVRIEVENIEDFHAELAAQKFKYARPGLETTEWETREVTVRDPSGNKLVFYENIPKRQ
jgi:catechol 2,3-dioxygenase-like lactoylglutathione lyase family enzyme